MKQKSKAIGGVGALLATGLLVGILRDPVELAPTPGESLCEGTFMPAEVQVVDAFLRAKIRAEDVALQRQACQYAETIGRVLSQSHDPTFSWPEPVRTDGELVVRAEHKDSLGTTVVRGVFSVPANQEKGTIVQAVVERSSPSGNSVEAAGLSWDYSSDDASPARWIINYDKLNDPDGSWSSDSKSMGTIRTIEGLDELGAKADQAINILAAARLPAH